MQKHRMHLTNKSEDQVVDAAVEVDSWSEAGEKDSMMDEK
jgi:hypothetical protein